MVAGEQEHRRLETQLRELRGSPTASSFPAPSATCAGTFPLP